MSYADKFKDPRWQKKRLEVLARDCWQCQNCGSDSSTLNAHHRYYVSRRDPWCYPDDCYVTLCDDCHESEHADPNSHRDWEALFSTGIVGSMGEIDFSHEFSNWKSRNGADSTRAISGLIHFLISDVETPETCAVD